MRQRVAANTRITGPTHPDAAAKSDVIADISERAEAWARSSGWNIDRAGSCIAHHGSPGSEWASEHAPGAFHHAARDRDFARGGLGVDPHIAIPAVGDIWEPRLSCGFGSRHDGWVRSPGWNRPGCRRLSGGPPLTACPGGEPFEGGAVALGGDE
jgi:hypothetical protein